MSEPLSASLPAELPITSPKKLAARFRAGLHAHRAGDLDTALRCYRSVLLSDPTNAPALHYTALLAQQLNQYAKQEGQKMATEEARRLMALSVALSPENAAAVHNFAKYQHDTGLLEEARQLYEIAVRLDPSQAESWTNLGNVWGEFGDRERMEECWDMALLCPSSAAADARFNISMLKLMRGDFEGGWKDYEARWSSPGFRYGYGRPDLEGVVRPWDGSRVKRLLIHAEQGVGDALMMARYIPLAAQMVESVTVEVFPSIERLFRETFPQVTVVKREWRKDAATFDAQIPLMSFPAAFGTRVDTVPPPAKFGGSLVNAGPIGSERGRIGVCWKGSSTHPNDRCRSMPFEALDALFGIPGVSWQSLQYGEAPEPLKPLIVSDYQDTASAVRRCELVITVDTSIAHLAASMGIDTYILLPFNAEWRWMMDRTDTPWYPSAKLWRQKSAGDWPELVSRVAADVRAMMEAFADA